MKGTSIAFVIEKGGTGKSAACFNIGWELSKTGSVLLIDLDGQASNLSYFCGVNTSTGVLTIGSVLDEESTLKDSVVNIHENLDILPADDSIVDIGTRDHFIKLAQKYDFSSSMAYRLHLIKRMQKIVRTACRSYDYVLLDPNPSPNYLHVLSLCAAEHIIIPVLPDAASVISVQGTADSLEIIRKNKLNRNVNVLGILFNRYTSRTNLSREVTDILNEYASEMGTTVFTNTIRQSVYMSECVGEHIGITDYKPRSSIAEDVRNVVTEIKRRLENE